MNKVAIVSDKNFDAEVIESEKPVVVSFTATWSLPSRNISSLLRTAAEKRDDVKFAKIDIGGIDETLAANENPLTQERFNIRMFPAMLLFKEGKIAGVMLGEADEKTFDGWLENSISGAAEKSIPLENIQDYMQGYYQSFQEETVQQAKKAHERIIKHTRRLSMTFAAARLAGGAMLVVTMPGPISAALAATIVGPNALNIIDTFRKKEKPPEDAQFANKKLRMAFNFAALQGGVFLLTGTMAMAMPLKIAGCGLGICIMWSALGGLGRDIAQMFTTDFSKYPVDPPERLKHKFPDKKEEPPGPG